MSKHANKTKYKLLIRVEHKINSNNMYGELRDLNNIHLVDDKIIQHLDAGKSYI